MGKAALCLIVAGVLGFGVMYMVVRGYLRSDGFREFLSDKASDVAQVDGAFAPFRWDGLAVDSSEFQGSGEGVVKNLRLDGLHTEVKIAGLKRGVWEIGESRVKRLAIVLDARGGDIDMAEPVDGAGGFRVKKVKRSRWLPTEVELQSMDVDEVLVSALLDQGPASVDGMRVRVEPSSGKHSYGIEIADGTVDLPFEMVPEIRLKRARLRYQNRQLFLNSFTARAWNDGRVDASGEFDMEAKRFAVEGSVSGVKCEEVISEDWAKRLVGELATSFTFDKLGGQLVSRGHLEISKGTLTALPVLEALAAYSDTRRFRELSLSEAKTDWRVKDREIYLSDLVLGSEGLVRLEGSISIRDRKLDGFFQLGLAPGTLARIPGAETHVFSPGKRGLQWTSLRITGTLDDPKEDLTDRLIDAAGMRMFEVIPETGEKVIKFTQAVLGESPDKAVEAGVKLIEKGSEAIGDVGGILDGFFRRSAPREPVKEERQEFQ